MPNSARMTSTSSKKSRELQELKEELLRLQEEEPSLAAELGDSGGHYLVLEGSSASYVNMDFYRAYAKVQSEFKDMAYEGMCRRVAQLCQERRDLAVHEYREIQGIFSRELQYQMVTLPPDAQREIMATIAKNSVAKKRILDAYSREHTVFNFKGVYGVYPGVYRPARGHGLCLLPYRGTLHRRRAKAGAFLPPGGYHRGLYRPIPRQGL